MFQRHQGWRLVSLATLLPRLAGALTGCLCCPRFAQRWGAIAGLSMATAAPTSRPTPAPNPMHEWFGADVAVVGQRCITGGMALVVEHVRKENKSGDVPARAGFVYWIVEVRLENVGATQATFTLLDFRAQDSAGFTYMPAIEAPPPALTAGTLVPGGKAHGYLSFLVRAGAEGVALVYRPLAAGSAEPVRVSLSS